jgi:hypothetical protein
MRGGNKPGTCRAAAPGRARHQSRAAAGRSPRQFDGMRDPWAPRSPRSTDGLTADAAGTAGAIGGARSNLPPPPAGFDSRTDGSTREPRQIVRWVSDPDCVLAPTGVLLAGSGVPVGCREPRPPHSARRPAMTGTLQMMYRQGVVPLLVQILADQTSMAPMWCRLGAQKAGSGDCFRLECSFDRPLGHQPMKPPRVGVPASVYSTV